MSGSRLRGTMPYMARLWEVGEMGLYAGGTWDSWRCRSWRIILISDDILDSSLGTEQPGVSVENSFCIPRLGRGGTGRRCRSRCPRAMMLCLLLVEVFRELQTSTATERSILPSLFCHTQSSSAQFYVEPNWDLEQGFEKKLKLPWRGEKIAMVSFNLDQFSRPAACADRCSKAG